LRGGTIVSNQGWRFGLVGRLISRLSPARSPQKAITPSSVKVLMLVEAGIVGFLSFWVLSEYTYNVYFRLYADQIFLSHVTTYTALLGLGIGLTGSAVAAMYYKNLRDAKIRLESVAVPKIRGAVGKVLSSIPITDSPVKSSVVTDQNSLMTGTSPQSSPVTTIVPVAKSEKTEKQTS
jgi:hypothetical protein